MTVKMQNDFGTVKRSPRGLSWTFLFFGVFVPLFRGDWKHFLIGLAVSVAGIVLSFGIVTVIYTIYMFITYNETYANDLYSKGFKEVQ